MDDINDNDTPHLSAPTKSLWETYETVCDERGIKSDSSLLIALRQHEPKLKLTEESHISLLIHILTTFPPNNTAYLPTHLTIQASYIAAATIGTLATYLTHQTHLTHLAITHTKLPDTAVQTLLTALGAPSACVNSPLTHVQLKDVGLSTDTALRLAPLLEKPLGGLTHLDLSNNALNFKGVQALKKAADSRISTCISISQQPSLKEKDSSLSSSSDSSSPSFSSRPYVPAESGIDYIPVAHVSPPTTQLQPLDLDLSGNLIIIETLNTLTHGVGAIFSLIAGISLIIQAYNRNHPSLTVISIAAFCASMFTLLSSSCAYHCMFRHPKTHAYLRRLDHCSIFLLIAGSYTPFLVVYALNPPTWVGRFTLFAVWTCASVGGVRSLMGTGSNKTRAFFALATGWIGILSFGTLMERMHSEAVALTFAGGIVYSFGLIFYLIGKRIPIYHVVWHIAVMIGGSLHYLVLSRYVVNTA